MIRATARHHLARAAVALGLAAAIALAWTYRAQFDVSRIGALVESAGIWAPVAFIALYALATVLFVPGVVFGLAGGALFGPVWGSIWNLAGATLGATAAFVLARYLAGGWVRARAGGALKRVVEGVEAEGWRFVALTRLVPLVPFNLLNYVLGLTRIDLVRYIAASLICMIPGTVAYTWLGHAGKSALGGESEAIRYGLLALALLALIAFVPPLVRRFRRPRSGWIETQALKALLAAPDAPVVLDVRNPDEFTGPLGHLPGARNEPLGELPARLGALDASRRQPVVVVCRTDKRSAKAAEILRAAGFADVRVLRGGMEAWRAAEAPPAPASQAAPAEGTPA
ncbi:MAG TPA: VTT domain-containing protein [Alphaproteobacteria bacterium]|jgi:uncharacterized membrane protein YdjX (TVP38/TMEM64 family)/rhodanese-related sulfurtransferase